MTAWNTENATASQSLKQLTKDFPDAMHYIFQWDADHNDRSRVMVNYSVGSAATPQDFASQHPDWTELSPLTGKYLSATMAFIKWCHTYPASAKALVNQPGGMKWMEEHVYNAPTTATKQ